MSTINKLSIRGIRSFGTQKEDEQIRGGYEDKFTLSLHRVDIAKITFESPLTLIVGENGCGKTTVIECLKYALTGEFPPGSEKGKTFIHDPKVFRNSQSNGQVKLHVTDVMGRKSIGIRTLSTDISKKGTGGCKTVDSTISTEGPDGKSIQQSLRIEEMNQEMASAMGVSKAILNNVIFCHQEDSNWPLDEGKKLKEKFDAIFGTTEYNKAIEKLIKFRKKCKIDHDACKQQKAFNKEIKSDADKKQLNLDNQIEKREKMSSDIETLEASLQPIEQQMQQILIKEEKFGDLYAKKIIFQTTIESCRINAENTKKKIKTHMDCSVEELEKELEKFIERRDTNEAELVVLEEEKNKAVDDEKKLEGKIAEARAKVSNLSDQLGKLQELQAKRIDETKTLAGKLEISLLSSDNSQEMSSEDLVSSTDQIDQGIRNKEETLSDVKSSDEAKDVEFQQLIDKARDEKTSCETNLKTHRQRILSLNDEQKKLQKEIQSIETSMPKINNLIEKIKVAEQKLEDCKTKNNVEDLQEEREFAEADKNELEAKIDALENDVDMLESISKVTNELETKERELSQNQSDFDRTKNKHSSTLKLLFPSKTIDRNFKSVVQARTDELKSEVNKILTSTDEARMKKTRLQTERDHVRKELKVKQKDLTEITERIDRMCDGRDYLDVLSGQKEKVDKLTMELAYHQSSEGMFKHYKQEIEQQPCCPLCHKNLKDNEGDELKDDIDEKIRQLPSRIAETEKKRKVESKKYDELNQIRSSYENIAKLEGEIKKLLESIKRLDSEYQQNNEDIENFEMQIVEPKSKQESLTGTFISDMSRLDELLKSIEVKTKEVSALKAKLPNEMPEKSLEAAKAELKQLSAEVKAKNERMNQLNKTINDHQTKVNSLQVEFNKLVSEKVQHQEKLQGMDQMKNNLKKFDEEKSEVEQKMKEEDRKLAPLKQKLETLNIKKEQAKNEAKQRSEQLQDEINQLQISRRELNRLNAEISDYEALDLEKKIHANNSNVVDFTKRISKLQDYIKRKSEEIKRLTEEVTNQEGNLRNLQDNMELRKIEMEQQKAKQELAKMKREMGELDSKKMVEEKKSLAEKRKKISEELQTTSGRMRELEDRIASAEAEMNEPKYKNAHKNYLLECYKEVTLKTQVEDLLKYQMALERSLLKFHADKMVEINQTIRDLWNSIYRGNDIDYIMIKTDEEETKSSADKKRSYNYRVIQSKNGGSEIDMRGRCSAGQKVLASLIIRMALAETFSANCKILALDEPTTNLDQNNIQALCTALARIVEEREKTGNFMLIVITHDETFVTSLERAEHYFKLSRDKYGRSRIDKVQNM